MRCVSDPVTLCISIVHQRSQWDSCQLILTLLLEQLKLFFQIPVHGRRRWLMLKGQCVRHSWDGACMCCYSMWKEADSCGWQCILSVIESALEESQTFCPSAEGDPE